MPIVSEPATLEEAVEAIRSAARVGIEKEGGDVLLSTRRLDRVLEHEPGDLTAIVEAGVRLSALNERLAAHGQQLALDPPGDPTVGACLAGNLSGPRRHRYGTPRDLVIGVTVVLGDGTVASSGGKVVKNVAGYDLGKLLCGSRGALGLVARVCVRLHPLPAASRTLVVDVDTAADARRTAQALLSSTLTPGALDLLWPGRLAVLFEGSERAVAAQVEAARALVGGREAEPEIWAESRERQGASRGWRSFPPGDLEAALSGLSEAVVRVGAGVAHVPQEERPAAEPGYERLVARIKQELDPQGVLV